MCVMALRSEVALLDVRELWGVQGLHELKEAGHVESPTPIDQGRRNI